MEAVTPVTSPPRGSGERDLRTADQQLADDLAQANLRIDNLVDALAYANKRIDDLTRAMMVDMGGVGHKLAALEGEHAALSRAVNAQEQAASWRDRRIKTLEAEGRALAAALDRLAEHVTVLNLRSGL
jgi:chromosome segregation ATPase